MPWTIETFAGLKANAAADSNWRVAGFELFRALNERQAALVLGKTQWYLPDGSDEADVTYAELEGLMNTQGFAYSKTNLERLQAGIVALLPRFTVANGRSATWTLATMEAAIGSSLHDEPIGPCDARFWQAQKDALDRMLYAIAAVTRSSVTTGLAYGEEFLGGGSGDTLSDAWTEALGETPTAGNRWNAYWDVSSGIGFGSVFGSSVVIITPAEAYLPNTSMLGSLVDVDFLISVQYTRSGSGDTAFAGDITYEVNGVSVTQGPFTAGTTVNLIAEGAATEAPNFGSGGNDIVAIVCEPPGTCPFTYSTGPATSATINAELTGAYYYFDITAELTDQA